MTAARDASDRLEHMVDDDLWSLAKYREMLFVK
jgi:glutamine synthetase type III